MPTLTPAQQFHFKEYDCLRTKLDSLHNAVSALERDVVIAVGVTWGFLYTQKTALPPWTYSIPILFGVLGAIRTFGLHRALSKFHTYLKEIEAGFDPPGKLEG